MKKIHALIVAAGKGARFGADIPKQYLKIGQKTILEHSIERLCHADIADLTLVISKNDTIAQDLNLSFNGVVHHAIGGDERWQSVLSGVQSIRNRGAQDDDWVLIHDAARAFLPSADLQALLTAAKNSKYRALILATPVVDTLKLVQDDCVLNTVDRSGLWQSLTPQIFRLKDLENVLEQVSQQGLQITDEASGFELLGYQVGVVTGSKLNIKLTYADDLILLDMLMHHPTTKKLL